MRWTLAVVLLVLPSLALAQAPKVLVLPFSTSDSDSTGRAIQASLVADLSKSRTWTAESAPASADQAQALALARAKNARFIVYGSYQIVDQEIRLTGQILDAQTGQSVAGLKSTGSTRDFFGLQDAIGGQSQRAIAAALAPPPAPAAQPEPANSPQVQVVVERRIAPYVFEGSDLERSLNSNLRPSTAYDLKYEQTRRSYYFGDRYQYYFGDVIRPGYGWGSYGYYQTYRIPRQVYIGPTIHFRYP